MKTTINLKTKKTLSRTEMRNIVAGSGKAPELHEEDATVMCNDETQHTVASCDQANTDAACAGHGGPKICSGGGN